jgi:hypothetical protein
MNKKKNAKVSSINLDSFYMLTKGTNGVHAKFIGAPWMGSKKKAIWVPKSLVTNLQDPSKCGYLKELIFFCRSITKSEEGIEFLIVGHSTQDR